MKLREIILSSCLLSSCADNKATQLGEDTHHPAIYDTGRPVGVCYDTALPGTAAVIGYHQRTDPKYDLKPLQP